MKILYRYKDYILIQIKINNNYLITIYNDNGNILMQMNSRRLFSKEESLNYIKYCISYFFKEKLKKELVKR